MTPRNDILFRRVGTVTLTRTDGSQAQGFGMVIPWGEERSDLWGQRSNPLGKLTAPLAWSTSAAWVVSFLHPRRLLTH